MVTVFKPLYRFLGLPLEKNDKTLVEALAQKAAAADNSRGKVKLTNRDKLLQDYDEPEVANINPFQWRKDIEMKDLDIINEYCGDLYVRLGYNNYDNINHLRDLSHRSSYGTDGIYPL